MDQPPRHFSWAKLGKLLLLLPVVIYLALCATMAARQRSLLYFPHVYTAAQVDKKAQSANLIRWSDAAAANIGFKRLSPRQPAQGSVLILYGNGSTATGCAHYADDIQKAAAMDVYILEYPGYEDRSGPPTEKRLFDAASDGFQMIPTNKPIYLVGESLGSGIASWLGATFTNRVAGMVLLSPFTSVTDVGQHRYPFLPVSLLLVDRFSSERYLRAYHGKVGVTVDGADKIVPEKFGLRLYDGYNGPKKLWQFSKNSHTQIGEPRAKFWKETIAFWQRN